MQPADIIIVDDNLPIREALAEYLSDCGFAVRTAGDGAALDLLLQTKVADVLLLDVNLPHENGYAIAARVRDTLPAVGILLLSARFIAGNAQVHAAVADMQLPKPVEPQALVLALHQLCALAIARRN